MRPQRSEVWIAELGEPAGTRPVIVIGRDDADPPRALTTYVPVTTKGRESPYEIDLSELRFLDNPQQSVANTQAINTIKTIRFRNKIGTVPSGLLKKIEQALLFSLGMTN